METLPVIFLAITALLVTPLHSATLDVDSVIPRRVYLPVLDTAPVDPPGRITNGLPARRGQFPHQAGLSLDGSGFCGGSLISSQWVLTAAHCAQNVRSFTIYLGAQQLNVGETGRVTVTTTSKIVHRQYSSYTLHNDVAVLRLPQTVSFSSYIQPVTLPSRSQAGNSFVGQTVRVSGWGKTSDGASGVSQTLNYVDLTVISNSQCQQYYGGSIIFSTICASGYGGRSTCQGDSGGPLVLQSGAGYTQVGVVSFVSGNGCASGAPGGYARVSAFLDWISQNTGIAARDGDLETTTFPVTDPPSSVSGA